MVHNKMWNKPFEPIYEGLCYYHEHEGRNEEEEDDDSD